MNIEGFLKTLSEEKNPQGFHTNIEKDTVENSNFRKVLHTAPTLQLVAMSLKPGEDIGLETHKDDQFIRVDKGSGTALIDEDEFDLKDGDAIIIPGGVQHNLTAGRKGVKLYTVYASNHHPDGAIHKTKEEAMKAEKQEKGG